MTGVGVWVLSRDTIVTFNELEVLLESIPLYLRDGWTGGVNIPLGGAILGAFIGIGDGRV